MKNFFFLLFISIGMYLCIHICFHNVSWWWKIQTNGQIWSSVADNGDFLYIANSSGEVYSIDRYSGKERWMFKISNGSALAPTFSDGNVYILSSKGILFCLNAVTGKELWRYEAENFASFFPVIHIEQKTIFLQDRLFTLYAIDGNSGKRIWTFSFRHEKDSFENLAYQDNFFQKNFFYTDNQIILMSDNGDLYSIDSHTGRIQWKKYIGIPISSLQLIDQTVFVSIKDVGIVALNVSTGQTQWISNQMHSRGTTMHVYTYEKKPLWYEISEFFLPFADRFFKHVCVKQYLIVIDNEGMVQSFNAATGVFMWSLELASSVNISQGLLDGRFLYIGDEEGVLRAVNIKTGDLIWKHEFPYAIRQKPFVLEKNIMLDAVCSRKNIGLYLPICAYGKRIAVGDIGGALIAANGYTGAEVWKFFSVGGFIAPPYIKGHMMYIPGLNGALYRLNKTNGKPVQDRWFSSVYVKENSHIVTKNDIFELTLTTDDSYYPDPWRDVQIDAVFVHSSKKTIHIDGFYYDKNTWKIRFNPAEKGIWSYSVSMRFPNGFFIKKGMFVSDADTHTSYPRITEKGQKRLTLDGLTIFSGIGIGDMIVDGNCDGNPLNDFFIGGEKEASSSYRLFACNNSTQTADLKEYLDAYGHNGSMFNIFRWSVGNASFDLFNEFGDPDRFSLNFFLKEGKIGDTLVKELKEKQFHIWMTIFFESVPFEAQWEKSPVFKQMVLHYIRYIIARYGAYISIWELANEAYTPLQISEELMKYIKLLDYEHRLVTTSWEPKESQEVDIFAPHWYSDEFAFDADADIDRQIEPFQEAEKPIIFAEQGNTRSNWDPTSFKRMRFRLWTAFFKNISLIFWNTSVYKGFDPSWSYNGNIYIGEDERQAVSVFRHITSGMPVDALDLEFPLDSLGIRSFALQSNSGIVGYFYRYTDQHGYGSISLPITADHSGKAEWIDPIKGVIRSVIPIAEGLNTVSSPIFNEDILVKVTYDQ